MKKDRFFIFILLSICFIVMIGIPIKSQYVDERARIQNPDPGLVAGRNVNMVAGMELPDGDPYLQRQNEPSFAVSTRNALHLLAGANDYRTVDMPESEGPLPGIPEGATVGDGWLGVFKSFNGGESWISTLLPGFPHDQSPEGLESPLKAYDTACDPTVRAGSNGLFYYSGIAFDRGNNGLGIIFVARFIDNNFMTLLDPDPIEYLDATVIDEGTAGQFADKPWIAVDEPRYGDDTVPIYAPNVDVQNVARHNVYIVYSVFLGDAPSGDHSKILFARSTDCGTTWEAPIKISEGQHRNQGTSMAVSPKDGTIYVVWRRFVSQSQPDAIMMCKSEDFGLTFNKAVEVATIYPFDQFTETHRFRTYAFPALAVDHNGIVYVAWADRGYTTPHEDSRIVIKASANGTDWSSTPIEVDNYVGHGHQFMPSLTYAAGKLMLTWYDSRESQGGDNDHYYYIEDLNTPSGQRHTIDVRIAEASPDLNPSFSESTQVSKYLHSVEINYGLDPPVSTLTQLEYNPPNYPLFVGGTIPFIGDYIDITPAPAFLFDEGSWRFNTGYMSNGEPQEMPPDTFHVTWTDNRDVRPPSDGDWTTYNPPDVPTSTTPCTDGTRTGMRNQNIYTAAINKGIIVGAPVNTKQLPVQPSSTLQSINETYQQKVTFLVFVKNLTDDERNFRLTIQTPGDMEASFWEEWPLGEGECPFIYCGDMEVDLLIDPHSSITLTVFVAHSTDPYATFRVNVVEIDDGGNEIPNGLQSYIILNPDPVNTQIVPVLPEGEYHTPNVLIEPPSIVYLTDPNALSNSLVYDPHLGYILDYVNPDIVAPAYRTPAYRTGNIVNPAYRTSLIGDFSDGEVTDIQWKITNNNDTASAYSFLPVGEIPIHPDPEEEVAYQLLIYKVNNTPASLSASDPNNPSDLCELYNEEHHELVYSTPAYRTPAYRTPAYRTPAYRTPAYRTNTLSLAPGESAVCTLRLISSTSNPFDAEEYATTVAVEAVPQAANPDGTIEFVTSLYIIADVLPVGSVNEPYTVTLEAYGGEPESKEDPGTPENPDDDIWKYQYWTEILKNGESQLPPGLSFSLDENYNPIISGIPQYDPNGNYPKDYEFTMEVKDESTPQQTARRKFKITIDCVFHTITPSSGPGGSITPSVSVIVPHGLDSEQFEIIPADCFHVQNVIVDKDTPEEIPLGPVTTHTFTNVRADHTIEAVFDRDTFRITASAGEGGSIAPDGEQIVDCNNSITFTISVDEGYMLEDVVLDKGTPYVSHKGSVMTYTFEFVRADHTIEAIFKKLEAWVERYNNDSVNGDDEASDMAIGQSSGNVFVTGTSLGSQTGPDFFTISYDSVGNTLMSSRSDGPSHLGDFVNDIAVDRFGNFSTTGYSYRGNPNDPERHSDYFTVKYNSSGKEIWEVRYDGRRNGDDKATAIAVDTAGNVYVTGMSEDSESKQSDIIHKDYYTIKYDADRGREVWGARYDNSINGHDEATAIAVDSSEHVYVTGRSQGNGSGFDYFTIKYDSSGNVIWSARYNNEPVNGNDEAVALAVDTAGIVYVTGRSEGEGTGFDIVTIKYNTITNESLIARYNNNLVNGNDEAAAIAVDSGGNVYVTGFSSNEIDNDYVTIKYLPDLTVDTNWGPDGVLRYDGGNGADEAADIAIDSTGIYVTGRSQGSDTSFDYLTIKYDSSGNMVWRVRYDHSGGDDEARAIIADSAGNVYVTGKSQGGGTGFDYATVKYEQ